MHVYPDQLRQVLLYIEALDEADRKLSDMKPDFAIGPKAIQLHGLEDDSDWGELRDEIGGAWAWVPPR